MIFPRSCLGKAFLRNGILALVWSSATVVVMMHTAMHFNLPHFTGIPSGGNANTQRTSVRRGYYKNADFNILSAGGENMEPTKRLRSRGEVTTTGITFGVVAASTLVAVMLNAGTISSACNDTLSYFAGECANCVYVAQDALRATVQHHDEHTVSPVLQKFQELQSSGALTKLPADWLKPQVAYSERKLAERQARLAEQQAAAEAKMLDARIAEQLEVEDPDISAPLANASETGTILESMPILVDATLAENSFEAIEQPEEGKPGLDPTVTVPATLAILLLSAGAEERQQQWLEVDRKEVRQKLQFEREQEQKLKELQEEQEQLQQQFLQEQEQEQERLRLEEEKLQLETPTQPEPVARRRFSRLLQFASSFRRNFSLLRSRSKVASPS